MARLIVTFSGGKDSLASLLYTLENISKKVEIVFCDTIWESPLTYDHIDYVSKKLNMPIKVLKSKKYNGMVDLAIKKKRFPSTKARFCTEELKAIPMIDWLLDEVKDHVLIIQGIRAGESASRAKMKPNCTFFKYYFEPYRTNETLLSDLEAKLWLLRVKRKKISEKLLNDIEILKAKIAKGILEPKYYTYRKKDVFKFREQFADDILRPVFDWTGQQAIDYSLEKGFEPNRLYSLGFKRVGCFPCVMSGLIEVYYISVHFPERIDEIREYEGIVGHSFYRPEYIPKWACKNGEYAFIDEIVAYVTNKYASGGLFENEEEKSCMSFYGLCGT